jgi:hypothetical protein
VLVSGHGTANITTNVQSSTFTNNFGAGYFTDGTDSAVLDVTVTNNTFTNNGGAVNVAAAGASTLSYDIIGNTAGVNTAVGINVFKAALSTGTVSGTVTGNIVGTTGVLNSACGSASCEAIGINAFGSGSFTSLVSNNVIRNFRTRAVGGNMADSVAGNLAITSNTIAEPAAGAANGIVVQSGLTAGNTSSVCADIATNTFTGVYAQSGILVRNRFPTTTFRLPGFPGPGNSTAAVATFLSGQNGGVTALATINANTFGGGAACVSP